LQQKSLDVKSKGITYRQAKESRWPNLNAGSSYYQSFGRRIDPTTNSFNNQTFSNQSVNLNSGVTLFSFNQITNTIKQSGADLAASKNDLDQLRRDISLQVAQAYLNAILAQENLKIAQNSLDQTKSQLALTDKLIEAGSKNKNSRLELVAQIARNESDIISAENQISSTLLDLKLLIQINTERQIKVIVPELGLSTENPEEIDFQQLYQAAIKGQPMFDAYKNKLESALLAEKISKSRGLPSLGLQGQLGTNFSSLNQRVAGIVPTEVVQPGVKINDQAVKFAYSSVDVQYGKNPYFSQLNENLGYGIGVSLSIPIYNNYSNSAMVQQSKISTEQVQLGMDQAYQTLQKDVRQALNTAISARRSFEAAQKLEESMEGVFSDTKKRFEIGAANTFELITARNNLDNASRTLLVDKYQYIFAMKVLDYYRGIQIEL